MKIAMIGPVYPYKGGIAHYTGMMSRNLAKEHEVINISFKLLYPGFLYHREQKDFGNDACKIEDTRFLINSINPFSWIRAAHHINQIHPDLVIVQWWHPFLSPAYWSMLKLLRKNIRVLFACHNILPHESFPMKKLLTKSVLRQGDCYIVHAESSAAELLSLVKSADYRRTYIPTFNAFKLSGISKSEAREQLGLAPDIPVLLFFGYIREYKGLKHLIRALPKIREELPQVRLLVVGDYFEDNKNEYENLIAQCGMSREIIQVDGYIPDKEVEKYFSACDLVVLPYESATQSGIVQIAYSFNKPVIATKVGGLPDVVLDGETGFLVPPSDEAELAKAVIRFFRDNKAIAFEEKIRQDSYKFSWDRMNDTVKELAAQIE